MKHIGLFEGIGGFSLAARWMGWETVAWCEWDSFCQKVLKYHFPNATGHGDITKTDFTGYAGQIDILTGGFPCQPYSSAGKRLGKEDDRHLWPEMLRVIRDVRPRYVVGENVRGLTNWNGGLVFDEVQADLENEGYEVTPYLLPACAVNAPHRRDRIWFVAYREEKRLWDRPGACGGQESKRERGEVWDRVEATCQHRDATNAESEGLERKNRIRVEGAIQPSKCIDTNSCQERYERSEQYGTFDTGDGREQPPGRTAEFHQIGDWQHFPTQPPVCGGDDGISRRLDGITFPKWREKSIGAYGNAIVPQVAFQIFKAIQMCEFCR